MRIQGFISALLTLAAGACSQLAGLSEPTPDTRDYSQCSGGPLGGPATPPEYADAPFTYEIRPGIENPGEEAFGLVGSPRERHGSPPAVGIVFEYDVTEDDISVWLTRHHAILLDRKNWDEPTVPGKHDGRTSRSARVTFDESSIELADLKRYAELQGYRGPYVFSSRRMAVALPNAP